MITGSSIAFVDIVTSVKYNYNTLGYLIKFKHMVVLNLIVIEKENTIIFVSLVNVVMYLNLIEKSNITHVYLRNCT